MKIRTVCIVLAFGLCFPVIASAQAKAKGPEMSRWWDQPVVRDIGLSTEQEKQVRAIVRDSRDRLIQLRGALDSAEAALSDEMGEEKVDSKRAEAAIERVITTRAELQRAIALMSLKLRLILTTSQWHELEKRGGDDQPPPQQQGPPRKKPGPDNQPDDMH
jgi:Spy/CpxP family protein refolding chaperone